MPVPATRFSPIPAAEAGLFPGSIRLTAFRLIRVSATRLPPVPAWAMSLPSVPASVRDRLPGSAWAMGLLPKPVRSMGVSRLLPDRRPAESANCSSPWCVNPVRV
ncbi:hypothetical protein Axi01nite_26460 [Actinoplanes xinjiangensis]|nr:hypothetical protein Axi01nite_26460 [Actinoplanes xinjiangensis]